MVFDPVGWAVEQGAFGGEPLARAAPPVVDGDVTVDAVSRIATVRSSLAAAAVERVLRDHGLTLGLFPERYEAASVGQLIAADEPGAGASGPGFASLLVERSDGVVHLGVQRRPEAQSGRALAVQSLAAACDALRRLAQDELLPQLALAADGPAADLLLQVAGDPDRVRPTLSGRGLLILIAAGRHGEAAERAERAVAVCADVVVADLGQNVARAFATSRYDVPRHADQLAEAGIELRMARSWHRWRDLAAGIAAPIEGVWCGREVLGAGAHGAVLQVRALS